MGLDMYLTAELYLSAYSNEAVHKKITKALGKAPGPVRGVVVEAMYWRKANAIHAWFVKHVQDGKDECEEFSVSTEQLLKLRDLCREVLKHREQAPVLMPSQGGFFFGSTDYGEYYFDDVKATEEKLTELLETPAWSMWYFKYHASW